MAIWNIVAVAFAITLLVMLVSVVVWGLLVVSIEVKALWKELWKGTK